MIFLLFLKDLYENQEACEDSICENNVTERHVSPRVIDGDKILIKKNKTVMSKLKKKALRLSKVFSPGISYVYVNKLFKLQNVNRYIYYIIIFRFKKQKYRNRTTY